LSGVYAFGGRMAGVGEGLAARHGLIGSFFTGLLAVVVATPCTAPFMGAAVAAALAAPPALAMATFLVLGVGLAGPYLALALAPGLARLLPRPGRWMEWLRQAMAFPMYGAAAWLVWVASQQAGSAGVLLAVAGLVLVGFALWLVGAAGQAGPRGRRIAQVLAACAVAAAIALLVQGAPSLGPANARQTVAEDGLWEPYSAERLAALRAEGRPVFVNMTAAWCVTCLVNEKVALESPAVRQAFAAHRVAALKGDWTNQAPEITAFLREHQRDGVPLYVYYPPGDRPAHVLPQILTEGMVLDELNQLGS
jgi:thiol:disulfide interchange protein DsbD